MTLINAISNNRVVAKHGLKLAWLAAILCVAVLLLSIGLDIREQSKLKAENYAPQQLAPIRRQQQQNSYAGQIVRANLFGNPNPKPVVKNAPTTTLDLTLQGILWASDDSMGRAIIMSGKKKSKLYSVGESIQGAGASIKEIRSNEVLLNRNGAIESLPLNKKKNSGNNQIISYSNPNSFDSDPISASDNFRSTTVSRAARDFQRTTPKPRSANGEPRKIRKPNFSGLDRALKKMGEL